MVPTVSRFNRVSNKVNLVKHLRRNFTQRFDDSMLLFSSEESFIAETFKAFIFPVIQLRGI